jgi:regulator of protease activity HflC (stomatin/prohibitin superfamily)
VELGVDEQDKVGTSQLALCQCIACCPLTMMCSWVPIATRTELVVLNYGSYTGTYKVPGCTFINCWGREMHVISTAAQSIDLAVTKILDKNGNPLLVSAIIVYHIVNTKRAALDVNDSAQFVRLQAMAVLKRIVSQYVAASITSSCTSLNFTPLFVHSGCQCVATSICTSFRSKHCS